MESSNSGLHFCPAFLQCHVLFPFTKFSLYTKPMYKSPATFAFSNVLDWTTGIGEDIKRSLSHHLVFLSPTRILSFRQAPYSRMYISTCDFSLRDLCPGFLLCNTGHFLALVAFDLGLPYSRQWDNHIFGISLPNFSDVHCLPGYFSYLAS